MPPCIIQGRVESNDASGRMRMDLELRYANGASLRAAWRDHLQHGGAVLPEPVAGLEENEAITVALVLGDDRFSLLARSGQEVPGAGRMLVFESSERLAALGAWVEAQDAGDAPPLPATLYAGGAEADGSPAEAETAAETAAEAPQDAPAPDDGSDWSVQPGDTVPIYVLKYETIRGFERHSSRWSEDGRIEVPHDEDEAEVGQPARLRLTLPGHNIFAVPVWIDATSPGLVLRAPLEHAEFRKALLHPSTAMGRTRREQEEDVEETPRVIRLSEEEPDPAPQLPLRRRIRQMGMEEKINLALSGEREARMALATDTNRAIHHYLLKNQRITVDEIAFMARQPSLNPDVLLKIADNPQYVQNQQVAKSLVLNPKTPLSTSIRLLDRLPRSDLMAISRRTNMQKRLVMAAKKKLGGS